MWMEIWRRWWVYEMEIGMEMEMGMVKVITVANIQAADIMTAATLVIVMAPWSVVRECPMVMGRMNEKQSIAQTQKLQKDWPAPLQNQRHAYSHTHTHTHFQVSQYRRHYIHGTDYRFQQ